VGNSVDDPHATHYLVTSFFDAVGKRTNSEIIPPILRQQFYGPGDERWADPGLCDFSGAATGAAAEPGEQEVCGYALTARARGNIVFKRPGFESFFEDLLRSSGDRNAGIRWCARRCTGQTLPGGTGAESFEQIFNAFWLDRTGYGAFWRN